MRFWVPQKKGAAGASLGSRHASNLAPLKGGLSFHLPVVSLLGSKLLPESTAAAGVSPPVLASWLPQPKIHKQKPPAPPTPPYSASPHQLLWACDSSPISGSLRPCLSPQDMISLSLGSPISVPAPGLADCRPQNLALALSYSLAKIPSHPGTKVTEDNPILPASCTSFPSLSVCPDRLLSRPCLPTLLAPEHASTILCPVPVPRNHHLAYIGSLKCLLCHADFQDCFHSLGQI